MKLLIAAALSVASTAAFASDITLTTPAAGATLHHDAVDMSVYFTEAAEGYEVVATYVTDAAPTDPARLVMLLNEGDRVSFGLPGVRGELFSFARTDDAVTVSARRAGIDLASN